VVVECGSGVSTLVIAAALEGNGAGKVYSLEHDSEFSEETRSLLRERNLSGRVELLAAPLTPQTLGGTEVRWYDARCLPDLSGPIDLLVVDGPPPHHPLARWPALEAFYPQLAPSACVLLDDGRRRSERVTAIKWASSFPDLALHWIDTEKGAWMLFRVGEPSSDPHLRSMLRRMRRAIHPRPPGLGLWPVSR